MIRTVTITLLWTLVLSATSWAQQKTAEPIRVADQLTWRAPESWVRKQPKSNIVDHEFAIPAAAGDDTPGRVIMMRAGGSVEANMERWVGQFTQAAGEASRAAVFRQKEVAGTQIHTIDLSGTYKDRPRGPSGPAVEKPGYRMLGAIIVTPGSGSYFVKLYGPANTVAAQEAAFHAMLDGLTKTDQPVE